MNLPSKYPYTKGKIPIYVNSSGTNIKIKLEGTPNMVVAKLLKDNKIPLPFECGFSCECSTCRATLETEAFDKLQKTQPIQSDERLLLKTESKPPKYYYMIFFYFLLCILFAIYFNRSKDSGRIFFIN